MIDWTSSMQQSFEFYKVNPDTWKDDKLIDCITSCTIDRDSSVATRGSATINCTDNLGECYIRVYLIAIQNNVREKVALGTYLVQTPSVSFDGKKKSITLDAYSPLIELKEKYPAIGYTFLKDTQIMPRAYYVCCDNLRAPVVIAKDEKVIEIDFTAALDDTWLTYLTDFISNAKFEFEVNPLGQILFAPIQDTASIQPLWTYDDGNSSILYSDITVERDLYGIPNVVEVVYSKGAGYYYSRVENNDVNSPISIPTRGREIIHRVSNPEIGGNPTQEYIDQYAQQILRNLSSLEFTITYTHGYCPVRVGDAVYLNYKRADLGLQNVKAKVIKQSIKCEPGCPVEETAVCAMNLWGE